MNVTEHTKDRLWQDMLDLARLTRYYELQTNKLTRRYRVVRLILLIGAGASLSLAVGNLPIWIGIGGAAVLLVATAIEFIWDWGMQASLSHAINLECCVIEKDYESLWSRVNTGQIDDSDSLRELDHLNLRVIAAAALISASDEGINRRAFKTANEVMVDKWRASKNGKQEVSSATRAS